MIQDDNIKTKDGSLPPSPSVEYSSDNCMLLFKREIENLFLDKGGVLDENEKLFGNNLQMKIGATAGLLTTSVFYGMKRFTKINSYITGTLLVVTFPLFLSLSSGYFSSSSFGNLRRYKGTGYKRLCYGLSNHLACARVLSSLGTTRGINGLDTFKGCQQDFPGLFSDKAQNKTS